MRHGLVRPASHKTRVTGLSDLDTATLTFRGEGWVVPPCFRAPPRLRDTGRAMPQQPATSSALDLTRRCFEAGNSGDFDALMLFFGPDSVWDVSAWGLGSHTGRPAIRAFFGDWIGSLDEYELQVEELVDLGNGIVLAV